MGGPIRNVKKDGIQIKKADDGEGVIVKVDMGDYRDTYYFGSDYELKEYIGRKGVRGKINVSNSVY